MSKPFRMRLTGDRELLLERAVEQSRWENRSDAVESALRHFLESIENAQDNADVATPEEATRWSTSEVKLVVQRRTRVEK